MKIRNIKSSGMSGVLAETWKIFRAKTEGIEIMISLCNKPKREDNSIRNVKRHLFIPKARENEMIVAVVQGFLYCVYGARFFTVLWLLY